MLEVNKYPKSKVELAQDLKKVCEAIWDKEITENEARSYFNELNQFIVWFVDGEVVDPTIRVYLGQRRMKLICTILNV